MGFTAWMSHCSDASCCISLQVLMTRYNDFRKSRKLLGCGWDRQSRRELFLGTLG